jgi:uncharacterized protein YbjT (DUF2867 family)
MILIIGASGNVGKEVVRQLSDKGVKARVLIHIHPLDFEVGASIQKVHGDMAQPATLEAAMQEVEKVFFLSAMGDLELESNVIKAAKSSGVKQLVKLSRLDAGPDAPTAISRRHAELERQTSESGIAFTIVRPSAYMQGLYTFQGSIEGENRFYACAGDGKMSLIDTRDIAEAIVKILTEAGHEGQIYHLTGSETFSYGEIAARLSEATNRQIVYIDLPRKALEQAFISYGMPERLATEIVEVLAALALNTFSPISNDFERITGKAPRKLEQFLEEWALSLRAGEASPVSVQS